MIFILLIKYIIFLGIIFSHEIYDKPNWKKYYRGSYIFNNNSDYGFGAYSRFKRTTKHTFKDLRFFLHATGSNSYKKLRYKNSSRLREFYSFYNFSTIAIDQNTKVGVDIRYHGNQGLGVFLKNFNKAHINAEIALAYDISDYLNDSRKTSYFKSGLFWDYEFDLYEIKFEIENFKQISELMNEQDLSRIEILFESYFSIDDNWQIIIGYEYEKIKKSRNDINSSIYISVGYHDLLNVSKLRSKIFRN